jgi:uncharacterized membrane protein
MLFEPLTENWQHKTLLGMEVPWLLIFIILILIFYLAGLLASTGIAKKIINWIEESLLGNIPGYTFRKKAGESLIGFDMEKSYPIVMVDIEGAWQIGFLIEHVDENYKAVYVPGVPSPWSGSLYFVTNEIIKEVDITYKEALTMIRNLGAGSGKHLKGIFSKF